ncbi:hypothetical protein 4 [Hubei insect virus 2]|uniref:hypothetical protein 4 n=1 Tax=Hubei insect virus 2 TaxID=1922898 RepID=UPI0009097284|nr:hypothetical protein 4 [Hubei insect virus 2]APG79061.1 hypothetical protein 4 [Hubei insect virus 2]
MSFITNINFVDLNNFGKFSNNECKRFRNVYIDKHVIDSKKIEHNEKILLLHSGIFKLQMRHISTLARAIAIVQDSNLVTKSDFSIESIVSINRRFRLMSDYITILPNEYWNMLKESTTIGFVIISETKLSSTVYRKLFSLGVFTRLKLADGNISQQQLYNYIGDGNIVVIPTDIDIVCEKYNNGVGGKYPDINIHVSWIPHSGNFMKYKYEVNYAMMKEWDFFRPRLELEIVELSDNQLEPCACTVEDGVFDEVVVLELTVTQNHINGVYQLINRVTIDLSEYAPMPKIQSLRFRDVIPDVNVNGAHDATKNLLFRSNMYALSQKINIIPHQEITVEYHILETFVSYRAGYLNLQKEVIEKVLVQPTYFINVVGTKGSGKSRFKKALSDKFGDEVMVVDSDFYGVYVCELFKHYDMDIFGVYSDASFSTESITNACQRAVSITMELDDLDVADNFIVLNFINLVNQFRRKMDDMSLEKMFISWLNALYDNKYFGLRRYQNALIEYGEDHGMVKIIHFGHTSLENYYLLVDYSLTIIPNFDELFVLVDRDRVSKKTLDVLKKPISIQEIEILLYTFYNNYINKQNSHGWLGIYEIFNISLVSDITMYICNYPTKEQNATTSKDIYETSLIRLPTYNNLYVNTKFSIHSLIDMIILPVGCGKTTLSRSDNRFIQYDEVFEDSELVSLYRDVNPATYEYFKHILLLIMKHDLNGDYAGKVVMVHDINIAHAFNFSLKIWMIKPSYIPIISKLCNIDESKTGWMIDNAAMLLDKVRLADEGINIILNEFEDHAQLFDHLRHTYD